MTFSDLPYPQKLVVEMLHYAVWGCVKTEDMKCSEIITALGVFFTDQELDDARKLLSGEK